MKVYNKYRDTIPKGCVYIGRPSIFGNPYVIGRDGNRKEVIKKYRVYAHEKLCDRTFYEALEKLSESSGLVCFCKPSPCHGDVLIEIINEIFKKGTQ